MNHKYNTICIQFLNYLSKYFSAANGVPAQILKTAEPPEILLLCYHVLCLAEIPNLDTRLEYPDPTRMIYQPFKTINGISWKDLETFLCCVMCSNTPLI